MDTLGRQLCAFCAHLIHNPTIKIHAVRAGITSPQGIDQGRPVTDGEQALRELSAGMHLHFAADSERLYGIAVTTVHGTAACGQHVGAIRAWGQP